MFTGAVRDWEAEYAEFAAVYSGRLRRLAYGRCGDWDTADRLTRQVLVAAYRRWHSGEPPDALAERTMERLLRRHHGGFPADGRAPALAYTSVDLIATGRTRRRRMRAVTAAVTVVALAAAGLAVYVLRPAPRGTPFLPEDCMAGLPSAAGVAASPLPSAFPSPGTSGLGGLDRLTALDGVLPLPGATVMPEQARREQLSCAVAAYFRSNVGPDGLERVDLGLDARGELRPVAALLDPEIAPAALTVSVRVYTASGLGTVTISVAPTTLRPTPEHCARLAFCRLSRVAEDQVVEQYGLHETPETARAGYRLGEDAEWWSVVSYSGHSMVLITITNTPDVRAALPASIQWAPLSEQVAGLAVDPRLAVFDPPRPSASGSASP
ncbi:RNA polymerase sigma factor [Catellatospora bangladeshensis]|uniref:Uncharacterized protein n=1 Tax=Catellatospora bangladeshensis TaxID=310355 RepID=A0A8J3NLY4_9ACTN|nr:hypothetical protein Cba03nite_44240 [Catellatospora bangladeshensis]